MFLPEHIKNNPNYVELSQYFEPEEVERIIESGIPINQVGVVPSLQVPPGNAGCQGLGELGLLSWDPRDPMSHLSTDIQTLVAQTGSREPEQVDPAVYRTMTAGGAVPAGDPALEWVEDNWLMIAAALGGLFVLGMVTKK